MKMKWHDCDEDKPIDWPLALTISAAMWIIIIKGLLYVWNV